MMLLVRRSLRELPETARVTIGEWAPTQIASARAIAHRKPLHVLALRRANWSDGGDFAAQGFEKGGLPTAPHPDHKRRCRVCLRSSRQEAHHEGNGPGAGIGRPLSDRSSKLETVLGSPSGTPTSGIARGRRHLGPRDALQAECSAATAKILTAAALPLNATSPKPRPARHRRAHVAWPRR